MLDLRCKYAEEDLSKLELDIKLEFKDIIFPIQKIIEVDQKSEKDWQQNPSYFVKLVYLINCPTKDIISKLSRFEEISHIDNDKLIIEAYIPFAK